MALTRKTISVGLIGCGEIAQVVHIPTFGFLSDYFRLTFLCDASESALNHCKSKVIGGVTPSITRFPSELCASDDVDVVLVASSNADHTDHAVLALQHQKHVFLQKPAALNMRDIQKIKVAEANSRGKVMVGYMRRYAAAFEKVVELVGGIDRILYARVRDIIGPGSIFVGQSGTFPKRFTYFSQQESHELFEKTTGMVATGLFECDAHDSEPNRSLWQQLVGLGSHDLSAMREVFGMPKSVHGACTTGIFWNAIFEYEGFNVAYESGRDNIPRFDAHIEVFSQSKSIRIQYDTPYIKGLPIYVVVAKNDNGIYQSTQIRIIYEDAYTQEFKDLYEWYTSDKLIKTTVQDAEDDIKIFGMIMKAVQRQ